VPVAGVVVPVAVAVVPVPVAVVPVAVVPVGVVPAGLVVGVAVADWVAVELLPDFCFALSLAAAD
jgi:hypothetical protein